MPTTNENVMQYDVHTSTDIRFESRDGPTPPPLLRLYRLLSKLSGSGRFSHRVFIIAFVGTHIPLITLAAYIYAVGSTGINSWGLLALVLTSTLIGTCATLLALRGLTEPSDAVSHALREYARFQRLPSLPDYYHNDIGILLRDTQETLIRVDTLARELRRLSIKDDLTQLYNRRFMRQEGERLLAQSDRYGSALTLMITDVDHFKRINDQYSHQVGDEVLQTVAKILAEGIRDSDLIARYGGDEFVVMFPQNGVDAVTLVCERLQARVELHDWSEIRTGLHVTISVGLSAYVKSDTLEAMLSRADAGLYKAKRLGRNQVATAAVQTE